MDVKSAHSLSEFFHEAVTSALRNQNLSTTELTQFYLVNLLSDFAQNPPSPEPLAVKMCESVYADPGARAQKLREIGDTSLFVTGFFPDSLNRSLVDVDYYTSMGETAYARLGNMSGASRDNFTGVFRELSDKFRRFVAVLSEISIDNATSSGDVIRLYEKYIRTGSEAVLEKLRKRGVLIRPVEVH